MSQIVKTVEIVLVNLGVQMCANSLFKFISIKSNVDKRNQLILINAV